MGPIIQSICAIAVVIAVGWIVRRTGALPDGTERVLTAFVYWLAGPALLFSVISTSPIHDVLGLPLVVAAVSGLGTALAFALIARPILKANLGETVLGAMSSALNNAAYIGIPISIYVLGDATHSIPVVVFQLGFFTPMFFVLADLAGSRQRPTPWRVLRMVVTNPMVIAAAIGFVCSWFAVPMPDLVTVATKMVGDSAPPVVLIAFGASLVGVPIRMKSRTGALVALSSVGKLVVQPAIAFGMAMALKMPMEAVMSATIMGGLPTAQNAFIAASRAGAGEDVAQGAILVTTFGCLPLTLLVAWAFHAFAGV